MQGKSFVTHIDTGVIYPQLQSNPSSIYSFLLVTGYLKAVNCDQPYGEDYMCEVALPNKEISFVYSKEILSQLETIIPRASAISIQEAIYKMDVDELQKELAQAALHQIQGREYGAELRAQDVPSVLEYGIAFSGKKVHIAAAIHSNHCV